MTIKGRIEYRGLYPTVAAKELTSGVKQANSKGVLQWHKTFLPLHFETFSSSKYGYMQRGRKYNKSKQNAFGQAIALVLTGELRDNAKRSIRVSGTAKRARGIMPGTQVANLRSGSGPDLRDEMTRVLPNEQKSLATFHENAVKSHFDSVKARETRRF